jgi:cell division protein ZapA
MDVKPTSVQVEIFGQFYNVRADGDPESIRELARFVDGKMREIAERAPTVDPQKIAILAALNIADELFRNRERHRDDAGRLDELKTRSGGWIRKLEEILEVP